MGASRTWLAAASAAAIGFGAVAGLGVFLGFPAGGSVIAGVVAALALGGILLAAARRAGGSDSGATAG